MSSYARYDVSIDILLKYYGYSLPGIMYQMIPVGCLVATVFTLSSLNKTQELTALFSLGMSLARVSAPMLSWIAIISVFSFWLGDRILPEFTKKKNYIYYVDLKKRPGLYSTVNKNKIWYRSKNTLFNIQTLNTEDKTASGMTLYFFDNNWSLIQLIKAKTVVLEKTKWRLQQGTVTLFSSDFDFPVTQKFQKKDIVMGEDVSDLEESATTGDVMSLGQLRKFIKKNKEAGLDTLRYEVDFHGKYGFAFAAFVMSLLAIPFSVNRQRSGGAFVGVGICLGLAFMYWLFYSSSITMGKHGLIPPILAAWGANAVGVAFSFFLLIRLKK
jgi:lipopolysaccharide export system permease protein